MGGSWHGNNERLLTAAAGVKTAKCPSWSGRQRSDFAALLVFHDILTTFGNSSDL
eukprot:10664.XXX_581447_581611_1 [CDS] Oithona nana genome sequencing.